MSKPTTNTASAKKIQETTGHRVLSIVALCAWTLISTVAAQYLVAFALALIIGKDNLSTPVWTTVYSAIAYSLGLVATIFIPIKLFKKWRTDREELGLRGLPTWIDIGLAPVAFILYLLLAAALIAIFSHFPWFDASQAQDVGYDNLASLLDRIVAFIALVIVAPIAEEIIFRGWLYGKLRARLPLIPAILLVSLLFGFMHGQWNVGVNVFAMSIILCLQREVTGTIYSGILLHMIKNGIAFYLLYFAG